MRKHRPQKPEITSDLNLLLYVSKYMLMNIQGSEVRHRVSGTADGNCVVAPAKGQGMSTLGTTDDPQLTTPQPSVGLHFFW